MRAERPRRSIRGRLAASFIAVAFISVFVVAALGAGLVRLAADRLAREELRRQARTLASETAFLSRDATALRVLRSFSRLSDAAVYRVGPNGRLVLVAGSDPAGIPAANLDAEALVAGETVEGRITRAGGDLLYVAQPVGTGRGTVVVVLSSAVPTGELLRPMANRLLVAALIAAGLAAAIAGYLARRIARPMGELADAASGLARGDFTRRVTPVSDDEIGVLASSFNRMAEELGDADRRQREFFLSISHELRTPLTAIQGYAEAIEDGTVASEDRQRAAAVIVGESRRLARLVSDLLDLARIDARRFQVSLGDVDVDAVLEATSRAFAPKAGEAGVELVVVSGGGTVRADRDRLVQVLANLVENALRYTPAGKRITLSSGPSGHRVELSVVDGGVGLDPEDLPRAFDRQYLWHKYRGLRAVGSGLGLAITKELVEAMGGSVEAANGPEGGAAMTVRLPAA